MQKFTGYLTLLTRTKVISIDAIVTDISKAVPKLGKVVAKLKNNNYYNSDWFLFAFYELPASMADNNFFRRDQNAFQRKKCDYIFYFKLSILL